MEMLDILDDKGNPTGESKPRKEVHEKGLWHKCVHISIVNSKGEILFQKRSMEKKSNPGKWDVSVTGHVSAGQTSIEGAIREIKEELGIAVHDSDVVLLGSVRAQATYLDGTYINNQFDDIYIVRKDIDISQIKIQEEEVEEIKFVAIDRFRSMIISKDPTLISRHSEYELLLETI